MNTTHLIIVVPCYNEESVLPETIRQLSGVLNRMLENGKISIGKILFVDDGSKDKTWEIITEAGKRNDTCTPHPFGNSARVCPGILNTIYHKERLPVTQEAFLYI